MKYWFTPIHLKYEINKRLEKMLIWFVYRLPRPVAYWCSIRVMVHATTGKYSDQVVPELLAMDALKRWNA